MLTRLSFGRERSGKYVRTHNSAVERDIVKTNELKVAKGEKALVKHWRLCRMPDKPDDCEEITFNTLLD